MLDATEARTRTPDAQEPTAYTYQKREQTRWWEVRDPTGELVCLTVYRRGAREVVRRLSVCGNKA
jgi:hypothetical protein